MIVDIVRKQQIRLSYLFSIVYFFDCFWAVLEITKLLIVVDKQMVECGWLAVAEKQKRGC